MHIQCLWANREIAPLKNVHIIPTSQEEENSAKKNLKRGLGMYNLEAPWIGNPDYGDFEEKEEYVPEYYPECEADYDY